MQGSRAASFLKRRRASVEGAETFLSETGVADHAVALLASFQAVSSPSGESGVLVPKDVGSGGWCFFAAFYDQLASRTIPGPVYVAVLAVEALADRQEEFAPFVHGVAGDADDDAREVCEARAALGDVAVYRDLGVVDQLTSFQCIVLDKLEGVITGDLYESRRHADDQDLQVLFGLAGLEALVLESNDILATEAGSRSRLYPSLERASDGRAQNLLGAGALDMVFVRYELGLYLHYTSVQFEDGAPWRVDGDKRDAFEQRYRASSVCEAIRRGDADLARMLVLSAVLGREALVAV